MVYQRFIASTHFSTCLGEMRRRVLKILLYPQKKWTNMFPSLYQILLFHLLKDIGLVFICPSTNRKFINRYNITPKQLSSTHSGVTVCLLIRLEFHVSSLSVVEWIHILRLLATNHQPNVFHNLFWVVLWQEGAVSCTYSLCSIYQNHWNHRAVPSWLDLLSVIILVV